MRYLINASNLHVGGGVQVATSLITELAAMADKAPQIHVLASSSVDSNLHATGAVLNNLASYRVYDSKGIAGIWQDPSDLLHGYDVVFTVFGPLYCRHRPALSVVGFAQAWILYPDNEVARKMPWSTRIRHRIKYWLQSRFFAQADMLVVELEHVRDGLVRSGVAPAERICVVHNTLASLYMHPARWQPVTLPDLRVDLRLGYIGRNYSHKNTAIFPSVHAHLRKVHGLEVRFYVTFTQEEWGLCTEAFRACSVNVGPLSVTQCPSFYKGMDGVVFPSLLECFSATPLEAMAMECPLFASDRAFIRDVCGDHAHYFDPIDAASAANCIAAYFRLDADRSENLYAAKQHALKFSTAAERARQYVSCMNEAIGTTLFKRNI